MMSSNTNQPIPDRSSPGSTRTDVVPARDQAGTHIPATGTPKVKDQTSSGNKRGRESTGETSNSHESKKANTARTYGRDNWPRFLIVESCQANKTMQNVSPFVINKAIEGVAGTVKSVKKTRAGTLLIEVETRQKCLNLLSMQQIDQMPVRVSPHRSLNSSKGVIKWKDLLGTPVEEIAEELSESGVTHVHQINNAKTGIYVLTFDRPIPPKDVKCAYIQLKVEEYTPNPMRCYNCQRFGHTTSKCSNQSTCGRCGTKNPQHSTKECRSKPSCTNCKQEHPAFSKKCPKFIEEKEIQSIRTKRKISFTEARKIVKASQAPILPRSFAAVVSQKKDAGCQTPDWPQQAVKPQPKQKAQNQDAVKPKPKQKAQNQNAVKPQPKQKAQNPKAVKPQPKQKASADTAAERPPKTQSKIPTPVGKNSPPKTSGGKGAQSKISPPKTSGGGERAPTPRGSESESNTTKLSTSPKPSGPPVQCGSQSTTSTLSGEKSQTKTSEGTSDPNTEPNTHRERPAQSENSPSYSQKAASPPQSRPFSLKRTHPVNLNLQNRFAALSEPRTMTVLNKQK